MIPKPSDRAIQRFAIDSRLQIVIHPNPLDGHDQDYYRCHRRIQYRCPMIRYPGQDLKYDYYSAADDRSIGS